MKLIWQCLFSPRLYKVYRDGPKDAMHQPEGLEKWSDKVVVAANTFLNVTLYTSPIICLYMYKRDLYNMEEIISMAQIFGGISCFIALSFLLRGYGRACNIKYVEFVKALSSPMTDKKAYLTELRKYDFEVSAWPATYNIAMKDSGTKDPIIKMDPIFVGPSWKDCHPFKACANPHLPFYQRVTIQILAFIATHTFGLRLVYPGCIGLVHTVLWNVLFNGRTSLVEEHNGQRTKVETADGNVLDTMFVDNRHNKTSQGKILVICCEGNSGFYEIGIMNTPIKAGYSALGWNHPGFAGSTGLPFPSQEHNAIDAMMQFAANELGFPFDHIVLFGWSIGGYTATWAAVNYPVKALILDATFDDLLPLAENQMPKSWSLLVKEVIRSYLNLNIADLIASYEGPVHLVRRTEDEIISLLPGVLASNRGNHLLMRLLDQRHPKLVEKTITKVALNKLLAVPEVKRLTLNRNELEEHERPLLIMISQYMSDYKSTHCTPLPESDFADIMDRIETIKKKD